MSCGEPHETDCARVLEELWLLLDRECGTEHTKLLKQHLDECYPCLERYGLEEQLKALLHRKCGGDHAPDTLKERLLQSLRQITMEQHEVAVDRSGSVEVSSTRIEVEEGG